MDRTIRQYRSDRALSRCGRFEHGRYRSRWYRGLDAGMEWLRLSLTVSGPVFVRVYATDGEPDDSIDAMEPALERPAEDLLLYGVRGRFLCFTVEPGEHLQGYELAFPGLSIDSLLPSAMQGDGALRKLLGVYQSLYMDLNRELAAFPARLDPLGAAPLPELARWLGASSWMDRGLPEPALLAGAVELNRQRGTRQGLRTLAKLVTGRECEIVEQFQWEAQARSLQERESCARLYGQERSNVTLLFPADTPEEKLALLKGVLDDFIPLGVSWAAVRMREHMALDEHSYLDSGGQITDPPPARLDSPEWDELILE